MTKERIKIALAGNPNSGKSTLFNALTGLRQKVGNYPGITVEKKTGICNLDEDIKAEIIDLPGTYSLYPKSIDERVAQQVICNKDNQAYPDITVVVADATNLRRSVFLITQIIDLKMNVVLALNMIDLSISKGVIIDVKKLSDQLKIPVIAINARKQEGIKNLKKAILKATSENTFEDFFSVKMLFKNPIEDTNKLRGANNDYASFLALCMQEMSGERKML